MSRDRVDFGGEIVVEFVELVFHFGAGHAVWIYDNTLGGFFYDLWRNILYDYTFRY